MTATDIADRWSAVQSRVERACKRSGRDCDELAVIAVSKGHGVEAIRALYDLGHRDFGEARASEFQEKAAALPADIRWHFIGRIQSRKVKDVVGRASLIHSVDRMSVIEEIDKRASSSQDVLLQVNISSDPQKAGVAAHEAQPFLQQLLYHRSLVVRGLMTIPEFTEDEQVTRRSYRAMREVFLECKASLDIRGDEYTRGFQYLSMGMSDDFEIAIEEGATHIRVGTAIFGERP